MVLAFYFLVMPGLVPGIHVSTGVAAREDVDGRDKPGHDELSICYIVIANSAKQSMALHNKWRNGLLRRKGSSQ
jgi:hypothetical protein